MLAVFVACLLTIAFLLGRESGRQAPATMASAGTASSATGTASSTAAGPAAPLAAPVPAAPAYTLPAAPHAAPAATPAAAPAAAVAGPPPGVSAEREAVARYFAEADRLQGQAAGAGDPTVLANTILKRSLEGDNGGFDELLAAQRQVQEGMAALSVPAACREHHRRALEALSEAAGLLQTVRDSLQQGKAADLASLMAVGQGLESKAREVDALGAEIKRRYGLAP